MWIVYRQYGCADETNIHVKLKNAGIGEFYGSGISSSTCGAQTTTTLELLQNANIKNYIVVDTIMQEKA